MRGFEGKGGASGWMVGNWSDEVDVKYEICFHGLRVEGLGGFLVWIFLDGCSGMVTCIENMILP